jgi:hypothetical protein
MNSVSQSHLASFDERKTTIIEHTDIDLNIDAKINSSTGGGALFESQTVTQVSMLPDLEDKHITE